MSGRKPESGAKLSPQTGMPAARTSHTAPSAANKRASASSPFTTLTGASLAEQRAVQLLLVGQERLELLARDRRRLRHVVRVVLLHRRGVVHLGHHPFPVRARRV